MPLDIRPVPCLRDNYAWLMRDTQSGATAILDPSEADPVFRALEKTGWRLTHILNTHHHMDHVGGNTALKEKTGAKVVGPRADRDRIPLIDEEVGEGDTWPFGSEHAKIFDIPGHTRGHIAFWFPKSSALFCGDTMFAMGCGRMFEGTPQQMWASLSKLKQLPPETRVYCGHEYTQANAKFALTVEPANKALQERSKEVNEKRARGEGTVPSTMGEELATNPFLRADKAELLASAGLEGKDPVAAFAEIRRRKDNF
jgi:hydroxyacylglutathione hydrolase